VSIIPAFISLLQHLGFTHVSQVRILLVRLSFI
jgi:hypothetical protein